MMIGKIQDNVSFGKLVESTNEGTQIAINKFLDCGEDTKRVERAYDRYFISINGRSERLKDCKNFELEGEYDDPWSNPWDDKSMNIMDRETAYALGSYIKFRIVNTDKPDIRKPVAEVFISSDASADKKIKALGSLRNKFIKNTHCEKRINLTA